MVICEDARDDCYFITNPHLSSTKCPHSYPHDCYFIDDHGCAKELKFTRKKCIPEFEYQMKKAIGEYNGNM